MSVKLVVMCHVEPGTLHDGTIAYDFSHTEGIVPALDRIVAFANRFEVPMGFAMTPQALALARVDFSGHEVGVHLHPMDPALAKRVGDRVRLVHDCLGRYSPEDQAVLLHAAKEAFEEAIGRPPDARAETLAIRSRDFIAAAPDELTTIFELSVAPPAPCLPEEVHGKQVVMVGACYAGPPEEGAEVVRPLKQFGRPIVDLLEPKPYTALQSMFDPMLPHGCARYWK